MVFSRILVFCLLVFGSVTAFAQSRFDAAAIVKRRTIGTGKAFEFYVLKDQTLWFRPVLDDKEAKIKIGPMTLDRTTPVQIPLEAYLANDLFEWKNRLFVTLSEPGNPTKLYPLQLSPELGQKTTLKDLLAAFKPDKEILIVEGPSALIYHWAPKTCTVSAAIFGAIYVSQCYLRLRDELKAHYAKHELFFKTETNRRSERLSLKNLILDDESNVKDVQLEDDSGETYSLEDLRKKRDCEKGVTPPQQP